MKRPALVLTLILGQWLAVGIGCAQVPAGERNVIRSNGFELIVNWCEVSERAARCELTATSLTQDFKAGFAYPILQDQTGAQFRMVPEDKGLGQYRMIAGEPYTIRYVNKDLLPTTVERVRGLVGSWAFWSVANNLKAGEFPVAFSDIPERPSQPAPGSAADKESGSTSGWETVGFWTYDGADGRRVPEGLVLIEAPGSLNDESWRYRLELKTHDQLPPRADRIVWPVYLSRADRQVCVDAPYPSYSGFIDLPGDAHDGVYDFASCPGGGID